jgi:hypothetical protein
MKNFFINVASAHGDGFDSAVGAHHEMMTNISWSWMILGFLFWALVLVLVVLGIIYLYKLIFKRNKESKKVFICSECGYEYEEKEWAIKCQNWCKENKSCNLNIIKHGKKS